MGSMRDVRNAQRPSDFIEVLWCGDDYTDTIQITAKVV